MFGGSRATSSTLGSSEDEELLLFAVLFTIWGTYILSVLCVKHQSSTGATGKVPFKILLCVLPYFYGQKHKRDIRKSNSDISLSWNCHNLTPWCPHRPIQGVLFPRLVDRALGRKQPLVSGLIAAELSSLLWLHPSLPQIIRLGECRWTYLPLLIFHCCWKTNEIISEKPLEETWCINLEWHYRWDITLIILPPAIRQDVFVLF